jgi:flagellin
MSLSVLNNIASLAAQNQMSVTNAGLQKTLFRLSSGNRITSGADDAAGLSIADGLHANVTALIQSQRNANDGVGKLQVADGALDQVTALLNRAVTLATEASTGTISTAQRTALDAEYTQIKNEINRIGGNTTFNGASVFSANTTSVFLGDAQASSTIGVTVGALTTSSIGIGAVNTAAASATNTLTLTSNVAAGSSVTIGSTTYTFQAGVAAGAGQVQIGGSAAATLTNLAAAVNGNGLNTANASATAAAVGNAITFTATASGTGSNGVTATGTLTAPAGASEGSWSVANHLGGGADPVAASITFLSPQQTPGNWTMIGSTTYTFVNALSGNDQVLIGSDAQATIQNLVAAVNGAAGSGTVYSANLTSNAAVTASYLGPDTFSPGWADYKFTAISSGPSGNAIHVTNSQGANWPLSGGANGTTASDSLTLTSNLIASNTITIGSTTYTFQAGAPGSAGQVQIGASATATLANLQAAVNGTDGVNSANASASALASGSAITFTAATPGSAGNLITASGSIIGSGGGSTGSWSNGAALAGGVDGSSGAATDLLTATAAQAALTALNSAVGQVASTRGTVGAGINRLQSATAVMSDQVQNLSAAEDNIRGANIAEEVAHLSKFNILAQTGIAAMAQANHSQQSILRLFQ